MKVNISMKGRRFTRRTIEILVGLTKSQVKEFQIERKLDVTDEQAEKLVELGLATIAKVRKAKATKPVDDSLESITTTNEESK